MVMTATDVGLVKVGTVLPSHVLLGLLRNILCPLTYNQRIERQSVSDFFQETMA